MDTPERLFGFKPLCFAAFVANTWTAPVHIRVAYRGNVLPIAAFARVTTGTGAQPSLSPYDDVAGLPPGEVAILFLSGEQGEKDEEGLPPWCPIPSAIPDATRSGTTVGDSFNITTDAPVVMFQINPFGGGKSALTGASLLLPTSAWDTDYVAVNAAPEGLETPNFPPGFPSMNIVAKDDDTLVTITPTAAIEPGPGIDGGPAWEPLQILLHKGQHAQMTQAIELTGSLVTANKPIGFMAGHVCMNVPSDTPNCDHGEQMIPPIRALGHRYAGVMYRPRVPAETATLWRIVGAVDGTQLTYSNDVGGPTMIDRGEVVDFSTGTPFVVTSQGQQHPFLLFQYMTSSEHVQSGYGDPDFVIVVPTDQYLARYAFYADPSYPETSLAVVRARGADGLFADVVLDCVGVLAGWRSLDDEFEYTRVDLTTGNFQNVGACSAGPHEITSTAPFGVTVWGWGTLPTGTANSSYGYPAGLRLEPINDIVLR